MSLIDILILATALAGMVMGWRKGLVRSLGDIASVVLAIVCARIFGAGHSLTTALLIMGGVFVGLRLLAILLDRMVTAVKLGPLNRLAGGALVCFTYLSMLSVVMNLYGMARSAWTHAQEPPFADDAWAQTVLGWAPWLMGKLSALHAAYPQLFQQ